MKHSVMLELIEKYIEARKRAWSETTLRSERHRLRGLAKAITGDPERLWAHLEAAGTKPYARVTAWSRVSSFWQWLMENNHVQGKHLYPKFRRDNARLFKNAYTRRKPSLSFSDAKAALEKIRDPQVRQKAQELLSSGMRWIDSERHTGDAVEGKGGKRRRVVLSKDACTPAGPAYRTFLRQLGPTGLKPHDLRKIFATHLYKSGFNQLELMQTMGWSSFDTAASYIADVDEDKLMAKIKKATE